MIKQLTKLANHLDSKGLRKEADYLDAVIRKIATEPQQVLPDESGEQEVSGIDTTPVSTGQPNPSFHEVGETHDSFRCRIGQDKVNKLIDEGNRLHQEYLECIGPKPSQSEVGQRRAEYWETVELYNKEMAAYRQAHSGRLTMGQSSQHRQALHDKYFSGMDPRSYWTIQEMDQWRDSGRLKVDSCGSLHGPRLKEIRRKVTKYKTKCEVWSPRAWMHEMMFRKK